MQLFGHPSSRFRRAVVTTLTLSVVAASLACRQEFTGPTGNPFTVALTTESFLGTLPVDGTSFFAFTAPVQGRISLTLLSLEENGVGSTAFVNIGIGVPRGTACEVQDSRTIQPSPEPQFSDFFPAGVYCARIADLGDLTVPATFALNITHPR